jgi:hypothetical protein
VRDFFYVFIEHWSTIKYRQHVRLPANEEEMEEHERDYAMGGLNCCIGSADCCHVSWDRCHASRLFGGTDCVAASPDMRIKIIIIIKKKTEFIASSLRV